MHCTGSVKRWCSSNQRHCWCVAIFLSYESCLKPIDETLMQDLAIALKCETESPKPLTVNANVNAPLK